MRLRLYRKTTFSIYMRFIAVADSFYLLAVFCRWIEACQFYNVNKLMNCWPILYCAFTSQSISNWLLMLNGLDRCISTFYNTKSRIFLTRFITICVCITITLSWALLMLHWIFIIEYNSNSVQMAGFPCSYKIRALYWGQYGWPVLYNVFCLGLPFLIMLGTSIDLVKQFKKRKEKIGIKIKAKDMQITRNLLVISVYHLVAMSPFGISQFFTGYISRRSWNCNVKASWVFINTVFLLLIFTNYSSKFFFLCWQSKTIRLKLKLKISSNTRV
ncbi:hypothetical protein GJ496_002482 [Pomphorhynchus laevis]|nr:hypothetical protein GJ496_002482 [Pomphorhynchus laevis]